MAKPTKVHASVGSCKLTMCMYEPPSPVVVETLSQKVLHEPTDIASLILKEFSDAPIMLEVARAESRLNPYAKNPHSSAFSVFQILSGTWTAYGCEGVRGVVADEIACARKIYDKDGLAPWRASQYAWGA